MPRRFAGLCAFMALALAPHAAEAQQVLSEADVVRLVRANSPSSAMAAAAESLAHGRQSTAGLLPNPSLAWDREQLLGSGSPSQDILKVTVPIDLSGSPGVRKAIARSAASATRADAAMTRADAIERAVTAFYAVLAAEKHVELMAGSLGVLASATHIIEQRVEAGTASGFARARILLATELARSRHQEAEQELENARALLLGLVAPDLPALPKLVGDLTTETPAGPDALMNSALATRAPLQAARQAAAAAQDARSALGWEWFPMLGVNAGLNIASDSETRYGYVAGASIALPLFSKGQDLRAEAEGQARLTAATVDATERDVRLQVGQASNKLASAQRELARFEEATSGGLEVVMLGAERGYREGETTLIELLDAQQTRAEIELRKLQLLTEAKRAEIRLRRATGELQ